MDFGIARVLARARQTRSGNLVGTLEYISPEQIQGREVDGRADFYSLGVMLYEDADGAAAVRRVDGVRPASRARRGDAPARPRPVRGRSARRRGAVSRAMAKDPRQRFANATEFLRGPGRIDAAGSGCSSAGTVGAGDPGRTKFARARERAGDLAGRVTPVECPGGRERATGPRTGTRRALCPPPGIGATVSSPLRSPILGSRRWWCWG